MLVTPSATGNRGYVKRWYERFASYLRHDGKRAWNTGIFKQYSQKFKTNSKGILTIRPQKLLLIEVQKTSWPIKKTE